MPPRPSLTTGQIRFVRRAAKVRRRLTNKALAARLNTTEHVVRHAIERTQ